MWLGKDDDWFFMFLGPENPFLAKFHQNYMAQFFVTSKLILILSMTVLGQ